MRALLAIAAAAAAACTSQPPAPAATTGAGTGATAARPPRPVRSLAQTARWPILATPVAFAADGKRWIGARDDALVVHDGAREVLRIDGMLGLGEALRALPDGGWIAGASRLAADGSPVWSAHGWAQQFGRFASPGASAFSPDGGIALVAGADAPSGCLGDCGRGGWGGALARFTFGPDRAVEPVEHRLVEHNDRKEYRLAASATWLAAVDGNELQVWPATGDGPATTVAVPGPSLATIVWADDRRLVGTRSLDPERTEVIVLDRAAGYAVTATWILDGDLQDLAVRPGSAELAVATDLYRARTTVELDQRRVGVYGLDGKRHAQVDVTGHPSSLSWSPRGDALLVATTGTRPAEQQVLRFAAR